MFMMEFRHLWDRILYTETDHIYLHYSSVDKLYKFQTYIFMFSENNPEYEPQSNRNVNNVRHVMQVVYLPA